ncbi:MAG: acetate/propionate family kinase [Pseudomonadota bacterium]
MTGVILALNAGSSSLKFAVATPEDISSRLMSGTIERIGSSEARLSHTNSDGQKRKLELGLVDHRAALRLLFAEVETSGAGLSVEGVGHRIVHGGSTFTDPVIITDEIVEQIEELVPLAPLHQPHGILGILTARDAYPKAIHVACFDSAFHARKPWIHDAYALPRQFYDQGLRRYGFHGLACESICSTLTKEGFPLADRKIVIAHLGNGCSVTAVDCGKAAATSMGFSTLDGLTMGTRCGGIDPGVLIHLMREGRSLNDLEKLLYHGSGLLGLSDFSNDMRDLFADDRRESREAIDFFVARLCEEICRMVGTMGGLHNIVFSGGIGENSAHIRDRVSRKLECLPGLNGDGVEIMVRSADEERQLIATTIFLGLERPS